MYCYLEFKLSYLKNLKLFSIKSKRIIWAYSFVKKWRRVLALFISIFLRNRSLSDARWFYGKKRKIGKGNLYVTEKRLRGYCTSVPYFWRLCAFSQKIKQLSTKYPKDLVRNVPRNSKITVLLQWRPLLWSYSEKCAKINIFHVLSHKSIITWVS